MKSRYFAEIAYNGTRFAGWQYQPNALSVQEAIENKLSTVLNTKTSIVGCGRTDAGVHASQYFFHFETDQTLPQELPHRLNRMLSQDIFIRNIFLVKPDHHARFNAKARTYRYYIIRNKSPFQYELKTHYSQFHLINSGLLIECSNLISSHSEFFPFCKSNSDVETMSCQIMESSWKSDPDEFVYTIKANRFLRGMVRLIVGMCIRVAIGEIPISDVEYALQNQTRLKKSWSAPANGLFLEEVCY